MNNYRGTVDQFNGLGDIYDKYRPVPPDVIKEILLNYLERQPETIVDLGCGTGLSTFIWKSYAKTIIGIDPNQSMLDTANKNKVSSLACDHIAFRKGYSHAIDIQDHAVDLVTCASAVRWMEPKRTMDEVIRVLAPGGVFAIYNHGGVPVVDHMIEKAYKHMFFRFYTALGEVKEQEKPWTVQNYLDTIKESGAFSFTREVVLHSKVGMTAEEMIGFTFSQGPLQEIRKYDFSWVENEINRFIALVHERFSNEVKEAIFSYRMQVAKKH